MDAAPFHYWYLRWRWLNDDIDRDRLYMRESSGHAPRKSHGMVGPPPPRRHDAGHYAALYAISLSLAIFASDHYIDDWIIFFTISRLL